MADDNEIFDDLVSDSSDHEEDNVDTEGRNSDPEGVDSDSQYTCSYDGDNSELSKTSSYWNIYFAKAKRTKPVDSGTANCVASFSRIDEFLLADKYTDVKIICQDRIFRCHRLILAAASEYFDTMFSAGLCESNATAIPLHGISVAVFEEILRYAYKGNVKVDDNNVYDLLCASEMLGLQFIENCCIRYVKERSVPLRDALKMFIFACRTQKESLTPTVSRVILEHLEDLSRSSEFFEFTDDELTTLLKHCQFMFPRQENHLLDAIFRWVSRSGSPSQEKKSSFAKLAQNICFQHISAEDVAEYFDQHTTDSSEGRDSDVFNTAESNCKMEKGELNLSLHAYVRTSSFGDEWEEKSTKLFTLQKSNDVVNWHSHVLESKITFLKSVAFDDRLYYFSLPSYEEPITFKSSSSVSLSADSVSLALPPNYENGYSDFYGYLCCDKRRIYLFCEWEGGGEIYESSAYNCELDLWSSLPPCVGREYSTRSCVTCDDYRIYLVGGCDPTWPTIDHCCMRAYDHRVGKWEQLRKSRLKHTSADQCTVHKEKIYISSSRYRNEDVMEVFDLVAGKWDAIEVNLDSFHSPRFVKLLSYNDKLHMFICSDNKAEFMSVLTYDSLHGEWNALSGLTSTVDRRSNSISTLDVVVFKTNDHNSKPIYS